MHAQQIPFCLFTRTYLYDDDWAVPAGTQRDVTNVALRGLSSCRDGGATCRDGGASCLADVAPFKSDATGVAPFKSDARRGGDSGRAAPFKSNATDVAPFKSDA